MSEITKEKALNLLASLFVEDGGSICLDPDKLGITQWGVFHELKEYIEQSQPVTEGYQIVPLEPTPDMRHAFNSILDRFEDGDWTVTMPDDAYEAMLAEAKEGNQ